MLQILPEKHWGACIQFIVCIEQKYLFQNSREGESRQAAPQCFLQSNLPIAIARLCPQIKKQIHANRYLFRKQKESDLSSRKQQTFLGGCFWCCLSASFCAIAFPRLPRSQAPLTGKLISQTRTKWKQSRNAALVLLQRGKKIKLQKIMQKIQGTPNHVGADQVGMGEKFAIKMQKNALGCGCFFCKFLSFFIVF